MHSFSRTYFLPHTIYNTQDYSSNYNSPVCTKTSSCESRDSILPAKLPKTHKQVIIWGHVTYGWPYDTCEPQDRCRSFNFDDNKDELFTYIWKPKSKNTKVPNRPSPFPYASENQSNKYTKCPRKILRYPNRPSHFPYASEKQSRKYNKCRNHVDMTHWVTENF